MLVIYFDAEQCRPRHGHSGSKIFEKVKADVGLATRNVTGPAFAKAAITDSVGHVPGCCRRRRRPTDLWSCNLHVCPSARTTRHSANPVHTFSSFPLFPDCSTTHNIHRHPPTRTARPRYLRHHFSPLRLLPRRVHPRRHLPPRPRSPSSTRAPRPHPPQTPSPPLPSNTTAALEATLQSLPALTALRTAPDAAEWYETRPHAALPDSARTHKLTIGALRGPGRLALFPLARVRKDESAAVVFVHLGRGLCGHDGIVHGGLLATLWMRRSGGMCAITNFPEKVGVTATLSLKYKAPTRADQFVVMKTHLVSVDGRKARVAGRVETLDGTLLVEAEALFIQPRYSKLLNTATIRQQIGGPPPPEPVLVEGGADTVVPK
ncbi:HotDog domain-containing protein [Mycena olivaceomarginata]|nr:HotDog domain-containing protein [Mycena olivaceomarginata]